MSDEPVKQEEVPQVVTAELSPVQFGKGAALVSVEEQDKMLAEYSKRRNNFRKWLLGQLVEGTHYGFPPGCEVRFDDNGNMLQRVRGKMVKISPKQWKAKPSLYKAGALYLKDLLRLRDEYSSDMDAWKMLGEPKGTYVRRCRLYSGDMFIGEGTGAYRVGYNNADANTAIKQADKCALSAAVINSLAVCADLFTQDREPGEGSAAAQPQGDELDVPDELTALVQEWAEESIPPESPLAGYKVTPRDVKALRALLQVWYVHELPQTPEEAISWAKRDGQIVVVDDDEGKPMGIGFGKRRENGADQEELPIE